MKIFASFICIILVLGGLFGCNSAAVTTPPPPPAPIVSTTPAVSPPLTSPSPSPTLNATNTPVPTVAELTVTSNNATITFPDEIVFSVSATGPSVIKTITLEYSTDERSLVPESSSSKAVFTEGQEVSASWTWLMKKTGSIPPGATIWWTWKIKDADGKTVTSGKKSTVYSDTRFTWNSKSYPDYDIYWHNQSDALINELLSAVQIRLARIQLDVQIPAERKPKVFIYKNSEELRDAVLFTQEWTGALAYTTYNIILTALSNDVLAWAKEALPHEITHLLVSEAIFGPFGDIPTWLSEGLSRYAEIDTVTTDKQYVDNAIANHTLLPLNTLSGSFPTASAGAYLAYAESASVVDFLIAQYGWEKMQLLLETFKDGATYDQALLKVYAFDVNGLEDLWKSHIDAG